MKRLIKFRFWCNAGKSFIQQYRYSGYVDELFDEREWNVLTPSQYTGCKDFEDKEIWEGDIVEFERNLLGTSDRKPIKAVIEYLDGSYIAKVINCSESTLSHIHLYSFYNTYDFTKYFKVIGNKFENPELLNYENNT